MVKSQIAFYGVQEANGFELLRLLRREFSFDEPSRGVAIQRSLPEVHGEEVREAFLMDVLREIGAEIEGFHSMLEALLIASHLTDLHITERNQYLLYLRNLPDKVAEFVQLHCGATTVARVWESVVAYHTRMRLTNDLDSKVHVATGPKLGGCFSRRIRVISRVNAAGSSTSAFASASGLSRTMAMSISPPSLWIMVGRPACTSARIATALFSHKVRSHSSRALCARVSVCGGAWRAAVVPNALRKGLSGGVGDGRC